MTFLRRKEKKFLILILGSCVLLFLCNHLLQLQKQRQQQQRKITEKTIKIDQIRVEHILSETKKFEQRGLSEYDPELVEFVRSIILEPTPALNRKLNLNRKRDDYSQEGQSKKIDKMLDQKRNGFFIESGGYDGEAFSNSLFFELNRNWTGLLIEPMNDLFEHIRKKNRNIFALNACISTDKPFVTKFRVSGALSGQESKMEKHHQDRIEREMNNVKNYQEVACFSLNTIMMALRVKKVDFFSLDIEGGEYDVVKSIDYSMLDIISFCIEWPANKKTEPLIQSHLKSNGYNLAEKNGQDLFFLKKAR